MDDIEEMLRDARPESGRRDRSPSARSERELDALISPMQAERIPGSARIMRKRRGTGRRKTRTTLLLLAGAIAIAIAVAGGLASLLDGAQQEPPPVAQPAEPDPSTVLSNAADKLDGTGEQSESGIAAPEDSRALVEWLTSGAVTRSNQATWLRDLSENGRATHAERGADETWLVDIADVTLVIREATGEVSAVIDAQGRTHIVPPTT